MTSQEMVSKVVSEYMKKEEVKKEQKENNNGISNEDSNDIDLQKIQACIVRMDA